MDTPSYLNDLLDLISQGLTLRIADLVVEGLISLTLLILGILLARILSRFVERLLGDLNYKDLANLLHFKPEFFNEQTRNAATRLISTVVFWNVVIVMIYIISLFLQNETLVNASFYLLQLLVNVIASGVLLFIGAILINLVTDVVVANATFLKDTEKKVFEFVFEFILYFFTISAALYQINVARPIVMIMFGAMSLLGLLIYKSRK